ncbi:effector-associated constant component EACC1 [Dactylosporangium cerinum]
MPELPSFTVIIMSGIEDELAGDDARSLRYWLADEDELQGNVRLVESPPGPGEMGALVDALQVAVAPGGAAAVLAAAVLSWVRLRTSTLRIKMRSTDSREVEIDVSRLRGLTAAELPAVVQALGSWLDHGTSVTPSANGVLTESDADRTSVEPS